MTRVTIDLPDGPAPEDREGALRRQVALRHGASVLRGLGHDLPAAVLARVADQLDEPTPAPALDPAAVDAALREVIADLDYDLHKKIEQDETTGKDTYPAVVGMFLECYAAPRKTS